VTLLLFLHVIFDVIWIGGMFLAYMAVRPAAVEALEPPLRLRLWSGIFRRFFPWVWAAVVLILASGFLMMGQLARVPHYVIAMTLIGIVMSAIFVYIYFAPFPALKRAVASEDWKSGGAALNQIRKLVGTNLVLGLANIAVAVLGRGFA
jgi:uncharacterized membrane protein